MLGVALITFGFSTSLWLSLIAVGFAGFGMIQVASVTNTILQTLVSEGKRARVLSYYMMAFFGAAPFGGLFAGTLADAIGAPETTVISGAACLVACLWYARELPIISQLMLPIFVAKGLVPITTPSLPSQRAEEEL